MQVFGPDGLHFSVAPKNISPLDVTGAGDALKAGICYGILKKWDFPHSVCWGVAAGTLTTRNIGACSKPPKNEEIQELANSLRIINN